MEIIINIYKKLEESLACGKNKEDEEFILKQMEAIAPLLPKGRKTHKC